MYTGLTGKVTVRLVDDTPPAGANINVNKSAVDRANVGDEVAYISNWSLELSTDIIETTRLGHNYKNKLPGMISWTATADGTVVFEGTTGSQEVFFKAQRDSKPVEVSFFLDDNTSFSGSGYIDSLSVDLSAEDKGNISISISGDGALTLPQQVQ